MPQVTEPKRPQPSGDLRLEIQVDDRGVTLYGNAPAMRAIADQLNWIANSPPEEHFECHVRLHLDQLENNKVRLIVDDDVRRLFEPLAEDLEPGSKPWGFEVTFMQIAEKEFTK